MKLDLLKPLDTLWFEDEDGNKLDWNIGMIPQTPAQYKEGLAYQHSHDLIVEHSICKPYVEPKWPVRWLIALIDIMPNKWKGSSNEIFRGATSISNGSYEMIKYLVEQRKFSLVDAHIVLSQMCSRCYNICNYELQGQIYQANGNTYCKHCKIIDPEYATKHHIWCCYRTFRLGGDVAKAFKNVSVYSNKEYMEKHGVSY